MKYYRVLALFALFTSALLGACGGGPKGFSLATSPSQPGGLIPAYPCRARTGTVTVLNTRLLLQVPAVMVSLAVEGTNVNRRIKWR